MKNFKIFIISSVIVLLILQGFSLFFKNKERENVITKLKSSFTIKDLDDANKFYQLVDKELQYQRNSYIADNIVNSVSLFISLIIALIGAGIAIDKIIIERQKSNEEKLSLIFNDLWSGITSDNPNIRAGSITGLQQFIKPSLEAFHDRIAIGLSIAGKRTDNNILLKRTITSIFEYAIKNIPNSMRVVNWQGMYLHRPNFYNLDLSGYDFRDTEIYKGDFRNTILRNTRFNASILIGNNFDNAYLKDANLEYADITDSSFCNAVLLDTILYNAKIKNINIENTDLSTARFSEYVFDWKLINNWRKAKFSPNIKEYLNSHYYPNVSGTKILIIMWEYPPKVEGGVWSALHNLLEELRSLGTDITVIIPWSEEILDNSIFGNEIRILPVSNANKSKFDLSDDVYSPYSSYSKPHSFPSHLQHLYSKGDIDLIKRIDKFINDAIGTIQELNINFDIIYAHDWVTFETGIILKKIFKKPLICHFHSTEFERQKKPSSYIKAIEFKAVQNANKIIVPSILTKEIIKSNYGKDNIICLPNLVGFKKFAIGELGEYESNNIGYIGRLSWQKGTDLFIDIALKSTNENLDFEFIIFGKGELEEELKSKSKRKVSDNRYNYYDYRRENCVKFNEYVKWSERERMFRNLFCLVVPSRYDPFNMVILEAMQANVPVIYTKQCGISDYIDAGIKFDVFDSTIVLNEIKKLKNDYKLWNDIIIKQERELKKFEKKNFAQLYIKEIETTLPNR